MAASAQGSLTGTRPNGPTKVDILGPAATHEKPMIRAAVTGIKELKPERVVLWLSL